MICLKKLTFKSQHRYLCEIKFVDLNIPRLFNCNSDIAIHLWSTYNHPRTTRCTITSVTTETSVRSVRIQALFPLKNTRHQPPCSIFTDRKRESIDNILWRKSLPSIDDRIACSTNCRGAIIHRYYHLTVQDNGRLI